MLSITKLLPRSFKFYILTIANLHICNFSDIHRSHDTYLVGVNKVGSPLKWQFLEKKLFSHIKTIVSSRVVPSPKSSTAFLIGIISVVGLAT